MNSAAPLAAFSGYGIELEYMIVDRDSLGVRPLADALLDALARDAQSGIPGFAWSNELVLHLLELKNVRPSPTLAGIGQSFHAEVARIDALLAGWDARLMPTGMHPWMDPAVETRLWPHGDAAIYRTYDAIFDCRAHGWANIQSMQLNLPFADDAEFARLHAAARLLLPVLPALAASSPIADGRRRDEVDYRMECYRRHAARKPSLIGLVVPDNAATLAAYQAEVLEPMYAEIASADPAGHLQREWLNARGAIPRFDRHAIEIRVIDMQECPQADLAVAALVGAVVRALYEERWSSLAQQQSFATTALAALLGACTRDAEAAVIDDARYLAAFGLRQPRCRADELWRHLLDACAGDPPMSREHEDALELIATQGPLARRILRALGTDFGPARLTAVYRVLCDCLADGRSFTGLA